jgi:hypothetical protein
LLIGRLALSGYAREFIEYLEGMAAMEQRDENAEKRIRARFGAK